MPTTDLLDEATVRRVLGKLREADYVIRRPGAVRGDSDDEIVARLCPQRRAGCFIMRDEGDLYAGFQREQGGYSLRPAKGALADWGSDDGHVEDDHPDAKIEWEDDDGE